MGVFHLSIESFASLSGCCFESQTAARVDGPGCACDKRLCESALRVETEFIPIAGDHLTDIPGHEQPFAGLPLGLEDIKNVLIHLWSATAEECRFRFDRE